MIRNFLKFIGVIQEKEGQEMTINRKIGDKSFNVKRKYRRINPWHPLSYVTIVVAFIIAIVLFGVIGFKNKNKVDTQNPFKWR